MEITLNNRPLSHVEDDVQLPLSTPNMMFLGQKNALLEQEVTRIKDKDLRRRTNICRDVEITCGESGKQSTSEH